jgi:hypothetical protein
VLSDLIMVMLDFIFNALHNLFKHLIFLADIGLYNNFTILTAFGIILLNRFGIGHLESLEVIPRNASIHSLRIQLNFALGWNAWLRHLLLSEAAMILDR